MMMMDYDWSWWAWLLMAGSMVAFWGLLIWVLVAVFRPGGRWSQGGERRDAERILAARFGTGEIDEVEYQTRLDTLRSGNARAERR